MKNPPDVGPPGEWIQGPRRGRQYDPDGRPSLDIDKPHLGNDVDHADKWQDGVRKSRGAQCHRGRLHHDDILINKTDINKGDCAMSGYAKFVDSHLTSIRCYEKEKRVELAFVLSSGADCLMAVDGVDRMLIHEMREQNIVEKVDVYDFTCSEDDMGWAVEMLTTPGEKIDPIPFEPVIRSVMNSIAKGEQVLLAITPVYGAMVLALVAQVS